MARYKKQFKISLPTSLYNEVQSTIETNPPFFDYEIEGFYGVLRDITANLFNKKNKMVPLSSIILQQKYGKSYRKMLDYMVFNNIIIEDHQYTKGKCRTFGIKNVVTINSIVDMTVIPISLNSMYGKYVKKRHNKEQLSAKGKKSHIKALRNWFSKLELDVKKALQQLENNKDQITTEQFIAIYDDILCFEKSNRNLRYFNRNDINDRVDNNLTSLKSYFKKFIISDIDLYQLDLKNSQPVLFNIILDIIYRLINEDLSLEEVNLTLCYKNKYIKDTIPLIYQRIKNEPKWVDLLKKEIPEYKKHTCDGLWYEHLADVYNEYINCNAIDRSKAKSLWMALAYSSNYSKNYNQSKIPFENKYKGIGMILRKLKQKNYKDLSVGLQQIESFIFIDSIVPSLISEGIIPLTIHDAIIVNEEQRERANAIMLEVLKEKLGFEPQIDIEPLKTLTFKPKHDAEGTAIMVNEFMNKPKRTIFMEKIEGEISRSR